MKGRRTLPLPVRITLLYVAAVLLIAAAAAFWVFRGMSEAADAYHERLLTEAVSSAVDAVHLEEGRPRFVSREAEDFGQVAFAVYDRKGSIWGGRRPEFDLPFEDGTVRSARRGESEWLVQDLLLPFGGESLWLRGFIRLDEMLFLRNTAARRTLPVLGGLILLAAAAGWMIVRRTLRPIRRMTEEARDVLDARDLSHRFSGPDTRRDEVGQLAETFDETFARLRTSFERERQFTDDVSHELRTPLAVITTACDWGLSQEDPAEARASLETVREKAEGMTRMVRQMLQLSRMDAGRERMEWEEVDLSRVCRTAAEEAAARGRTVCAEQVEPDLRMRGDEGMLTRLLIILLDNAVKWAREKVHVSLSRSEAGLTLRVADDGPGIREEDLPHVFERFWQADAARSGDGGTGLGLAMAEGITRLHGGTISAGNGPEGGAVFTVTLPPEGGGPETRDRNRPGNRGKDQNG